MHSHTQTCRCALSVCISVHILCVCVYMHVLKFSMNVCVDLLLYVNVCVIISNKIIKITNLYFIIIVFAILTYRSK